MVYESIILNSDRHITIASFLSDRKEFGPAISHLVLGSEEMVKALIVFLEGLGLNLRAIKGVKRFFTNHQVRHTLSKFYYLINVIVKRTLDLKDFLHEVLKQKERGNELQGLNKAISESDSERLTRYSKVWAEKSIGLFEDFFQHIDFWEQADEYKMRGFYVDYKDDLKTPEQITVADYQIAVTSTKSFIAECKRMIDILSNLSEEEKEELIVSFNANAELKYLFAGIIDKGWNYFEKE